MSRECPNGGGASGGRTGGFSGGAGSDQECYKASLSLSKVEPHNADSLSTVR